MLKESEIESFRDNEYNQIKKDLIASKIAGREVSKEIVIDIIEKVFIMEWEKRPEVKL